MSAKAACPPEPLRNLPRAHALFRLAQRPELPVHETYSRRIVYAFGTIEEGANAQPPQPPVEVK